MVKVLPANAGDTRDKGSVPGSGRSLGGGNGTQLHYACLGNSLDKGAWWSIVRGVARSRTQLSTHTEQTKPCWKYNHWSLMKGILSVLERWQILAALSICLLEIFYLLACALISELFLHVLRLTAKAIWTTLWFCSDSVPCFTVFPVIKIHKVPAFCSSYWTFIQTHKYQNSTISIWFCSMSIQMVLK